MKLKTGVFLRGSGLCLALRRPARGRMRRWRDHHQCPGSDRYHAGGDRDDDHPGGDHYPGRGHYPGRDGHFPHYRRFAGCGQPADSHRPRHHRLHQVCQAGGLRRLCGQHRRHRPHHHRGRGRVSDVPPLVAGRGDQLLFTESAPGDKDPFQLWVVNADGSGKKQITEGSTSEALGATFHRFAFATWSPDGKQIACTGWVRYPPERAAITVMNAGCAAAALATSRVRTSRLYQPEGSAV